MLEDFGHCASDKYFQYQVEKKRWDDYRGPLIFPIKYENPHLFFRDMWKINYEK